MTLSSFSSGKLDMLNSKVTGHFDDFRNFYRFICVRFLAEMSTEKHVHQKNADKAKLCRQSEHLDIPHSFDTIHIALRYVKQPL